MGQAQNTDATAITSPTPNIVGWRKLSSSMIVSCTAIQIICPQPMTKARNGAARNLKQAHRGHNQRPDAEQPAQDEARK